jgi:RND family efflux transporter MFP subunit
MVLLRNIRSKLTKKIIIVGLIILIVGGYFLSSRNKNAVVPLFTTVKKQTLRQEVSASGVLTGKESVALHFKSGGKLSFIKVKVGDHIKAGTVIAGLDTQDLQIVLRQAENTYRDKQATVDKIHDDLKDHQKDETFTQRQTRTAAEVANDNAYDSLKAAQRSFQDAVLTSPIDGIVTQADPIPGQNVSAADIIVSISDFSESLFSADVDEADISKISVGQLAETTLNAYGDKIFRGQVLDITPQTRTISSGATVVTVKISLNDSSIKQISGLNGQSTIILDEKKNVLAIPSDAIIEDNIVLIKTPTGIKKQKITTGFKTDTDVEAIGISEGDQIVTNPADVAKNL